MEGTTPGRTITSHTCRTRVDDLFGSTLSQEASSVVTFRKVLRSEDPKSEQPVLRPNPFGPARREREKPDRFHADPVSLNSNRGTTFLGLYERQSGSGRQRDKSFELCVGTESIAPLASNLSDRSCHALAEADGQPITDLAGGECPEPDSAMVSWLARAVPRPGNGRCRPHGAADCLLPSRTRSPSISITGGRRHIVPVRIGSTGCGNDRAAQEIGERERECSAVGRWTQRISDSVWHVVTCRSVNRQLPSHRGGSNGRSTDPTP